MADRPLLIATSNKGKLREYADLLSTLPIDVISLIEVGDTAEVDESGNSFAENAALKATGYSRQTGRVTLADDSGLEIDALDGRPGVSSARYGGVETPFGEKMKLLLAELEKTARCRIEPHASSQP